MKRFWFGAALLATFLLLGAALSLWTSGIHCRISNTLAQAEGLAQAGDMAGAGELSRQAQSSWQRNRCVTAALADHTPMEEIDGLFRELSVFLAMDEPVHFAATCARLSLLLQAMGESHSISWWNLL